MRIVSVIAFVAVGLTASRSDAGADSIPFRLAPQGGIVVPVLLNGTGPFPFLLDTGSSHSAVFEDLAVRLGAPAVARAVVVSPIGRDERPVVRLERLDLGAVTAVDVMATVTRRKHHGEGEAIQGIIGQDVLAALHYTLDFRKRRMVWHSGAAPVPCRGTTLELELQEGRFVVRLPQARSMLRFVPDSGAGGFVLFERRGRTLPPMETTPGLIGVHTLTERTEVRGVWLRELRLGTLTLRDQVAALVERQEPDAPDGLLPLHIFARVTFNGPRRVLVVEEP